MQTNPPIVVIAFNRYNSLERLLKSLARADYPDNDVTLIISIDKGPNNHDVHQLALDFEWAFGEKKVTYQYINLGLRKHVISCASHCEEYGSVILLEDDLFVSPRFYDYACKALAFSIDKDYIGGISLYNHQFNVNAQQNFSPIEDGFDNWYLQFASSWGQAWTRVQWAQFKDWYLQNPHLEPNPKIPKNIFRWSEKSWLKYFIYYLVERDKYFIYPKVSLTTNFSDSGTHIAKTSTKFQVPLDSSKSHEYKFSNLESSNAVYDVFFENTKLYKSLGMQRGDVCVDLYRTKPVENISVSFLLSQGIYNFRIVRTFGCELKPIDENIIHDIAGTDIYLYEIDVPEINPNRINFEKDLMYHIKHISRKDVQRLIVVLYSNRIRKLLGRLFRK